VGAARRINQAILQHAVGYFMKCLQITCFITFNQHDATGFSCCDDHTSFASYGETATAAHNVVATVPSLCDPALTLLTVNLNTLQRLSKIKSLSLF
jgi:hypothetical protein